MFKPTVEQHEKEVIFSDKDKEKNKDYYHYVYILGKGENHVIQVEGAKSSTVMINSTNVVRWLNFIIIIIKSSNKSYHKQLISQLL